MKRAVKTLLWGVTDPRQALEAGVLGIDGVIVAVRAGDAEPPLGAEPVSPDVATRIARALPPLAARFAVVPPGEPVPDGFTGAVTPIDARRPVGVAVRIVRVGPHAADAERAPADAEALWIPPGPGSSTATRFDFARIERLGHRARTILEVPDGARGVEPAIRLGRPYAVLFGEAVWFRPGIVDMDELERALFEVARLNKAAYGG